MYTHLFFSQHCVCPLLNPPWCARSSVTPMNNKVISSPPTYSYGIKPFARPGGVPAHWNGAHLSTVSIHENPLVKLDWLTAIKPITAIWPNPLVLAAQVLPSLAAVDREQSRSISAWKVGFSSPSTPGNLPHFRQLMTIYSLWTSRLSVPHIDGNEPWRMWSSQRC